MVNLILLLTGKEANKQNKNPVLCALLFEGEDVLLNNQ